MTTRLPFISLIIRSRNEADCIKQTLDGVSNQVMRPDEIIVVDSGSTDGTLDIVSQFDVYLIKIPFEQFTYGFAYNEGARRARGSYLISLSAHAVPTNPFWLKNLVQPLISDPAVAGASSHQCPHPGQSLEPYLVLWQTLFRLGVKTPLVERYLFSNASSAIRSHLWYQTPFDETVSICEDHQWAMKMQRNGYRIAYTLDSIVYHSHRMRTLIAIRRRFRELHALISFYVALPKNMKRS